MTNNILSLKTKLWKELRYIGDEEFWEGSMGVSGSLSSTKMIEVDYGQVVDVATNTKRSRSCKYYASSQRSIKYQQLTMDDFPPVCTIKDVKMIDDKDLGISLDTDDLEGDVSQIGRWPMLTMRVEKILKKRFTLLEVAVAQGYQGNRNGRCSKKDDCYSIRLMLEVKLSLVLPRIESTASKDCNFYENKMVGKSVLNNMGRVTGQRKVRPIWNNAQRCRNVAKQRSPRAAASISTARHVNTAALKQKGNPQYALHDQGIFDSGCSRHMTGNKSYLIDYQDIDGGFVTFVWSLKGTECLVLSPDFKLLDESQVLLKVPRQNNMYSFDLKNVVPSGGLTCLFAKAIIDESNLWHRRLGHINFKTINKLVRGNLVRGLPSKLFENDHTCVACQKGKQFMLLVKTSLTKAHNKTPYELLLGRPPSISFMRLFGYLVTILNTLDPLAKFDRKADEGFLVGYFINRKDADELLPSGNTAGQGFDNADDQERIDSSTQDVNTAGPSINTVSENINTVEPKRCWREAMQEELLQFKLQKVWTLVNLPKGKRAIGTKWIDVNSAFLYGTIEDEVYVCQPPGFEDPQFPDKVYKVYVDDIIFGSTKKSLCVEFEQMMHKRFQMSSMGELTFFLGLQVQQKEDGIFISQDKSMIGSLMYLTASRPDIMFVVCACARDSPFNLEAFSDSDYAGASLDRKSTTGGCQFLSKRLVSWQCKKQTIVANSTNEAEYVAAANYCGQVVGLGALIPYWRMYRSSNLGKELGWWGWGLKFRMYPRYVHVFLDKQVDGMASIKGCFVTTSPYQEGVANIEENHEGFSYSLLKFPFQHIITQPSSSKPQKKKSRRKQRKDSAPTEPTTEEATPKEHVSTPSYDPPLSAKEITSLKKRVKQLEKRRKSRTSGLRRLRKVGSSSRVESSNDASLGAQAGCSNSVLEVQEFMVLVKRSSIVYIYKTHFLLHITSSTSKRDKGKGKIVEPEVPLKKKDQVSLDEEMARNLEAQLQALNLD
ncbi:uncharacterized mitochondrial protein-like protein [Tanacetum coccineum]